METTAEATIKDGKVEIPLFKMEKDGNGYEEKVVNLDHPDNCPRSGVIMIESIKKKNYDLDTDIDIGLSCYRDKATGILWGKKAGIDNITKAIKWMPIKMKMLNIFDLSVPDQAEKCAILMRSPVVEGSPNAVYRLTKFRVHDIEKAATNDIKRIKDGQKALSLAQGLYGEELVNMGRNLGISVQSTSITVLESEVLKRAEKDPKEFLRIWENPHRELITILNRALETAVIESDPIRGHLFNGVPLGDTEAAVIEYLHKHRDIATNIDFRSKSKQSETLKSMAKVTSNVISKTDNDAELGMLRKQLAETQEALEKLSAETIRTAIAEKNDEITPEKEELERLKKEASDLGIKGLQNLKDVNKIPELKTKIENAKALLEK